MKKIILIGLLLGLISLTLVPSSDAAIRRVPARYNMVSFFGGYASPYGEYDEIGPLPLTDVEGNRVEVDADQLFEDSWHLGFQYGAFWNQHFLLTLGFRYTSVNLNEEIFLAADDIDVGQYDLDINLDLYPLDITQVQFSPYVGAGFRAGFTTVGGEGYESESDLTVAASANFGADFKLFTSADARSFVTLASVNDFTFAASSDRPKYLNIGGALRYWFR